MNPWLGMGPAPDGPTLVLATHNGHKLTEMQRLVEQAGLPITVIGLSDLPRVPVPDETGSTFEENALIKARAAAEAHGLPTLADDSGLSVDVLNGMPGVRSARWAGKDASDQDNLDLLLRQIDDVPESARGGRFTCAMALVVPVADGPARERTVVAHWPGRVLFEAIGSNGFGYDPIFLPDDAKVSSAQLDPAEKDALSHRGQAVRQMMPILAEELDTGEPA